jgi:hypothetical protein
MLRLRPLPVLLALFLCGCASRPTPPTEPAENQAAAPVEPTPPELDGSELGGEADALSDAENRLAEAELTPEPEAEPSTEATPFATLAQALDGGFLNSAQAQSNLPLRLPAPPRAPVIRDPRVPDLKAKIAKYKLFTAYRTLQGIYVSAGDYANAARLMREESALYAAKGLRDASVIAAQNAARYAPTTSLFLERAPTPQEVTGLYSGAPNEPFVGCYLGAFIDREPGLKQTYQDENWQTHRQPAEWARLTGKPHGTMFMYLAYGQKFPRAWIENLKQNGVIPQIAWEPHNLNEVRDDKYLQDFARECASVDWPIFIRFASEMNGKWTPYHGNPKLYREKFALMHRVMHRYAPRIATIWCVNNPPLGNVDAYYPGDNGCDWVGVNFYAVPFNENKRDKPAFDDSPLALLDPIYKKYASRKPIAICEFAASHKPAMDRVSRPDFAVQKLAAVYGALPRLYPRVKLIDWFSMNTLPLNLKGKTLSDYSLSGNKQVLAAYRRATATPYFLSRAQRLSDPKPFLPRPLLDNTQVRGSARLSSWSNFQLAGARTFAMLGGKVVYASSYPGAHDIALDLSRGPFGKQKFEVLVYDARNRFVGGTSRTLQVLQ